MPRLVRKKLARSDFVELVSSKLSANRHEVKNIINLFLSELGKALQKDAVIEFRGFGTFFIRKRLGRPNARNLRTGEIVAAKPHGIVYFRPGRLLKQGVRSLRT